MNFNNNVVKYVDIDKFNELGNLQYRRDVILGDPLEIRWSKEIKGNYLTEFSSSVLINDEKLLTLIKLKNELNGDNRL
jgi:hypothetical protein